MMLRYSGGIALLTGGSGRERAGSLASARDVSEALTRLGLQHQAIDIAAIGSFSPGDFDVAFLTTHGEGGEDGTLQGYLEKMSIPYTGSGVSASAVSMDKRLSSWIAKSLGCSLPDFMVFRTGHSLVEAKEFLLKHDRCVVKPAYGGGSLGVEQMNNVVGLDAYLAGREAQDNSEPLLLCEWVDGVEISCAAIRIDCAVKALPVLETEFDAPIYTYDIKHTAAARAHYCPGRIPKELAEAVRNVSERLYTSLDMSGFARFDFIVDTRRDTAWFLEINTIPGLSRQSNLAHMAAAAGISYEKMIEMELASSLDQAEGYVYHPAPSNAKGVSHDKTVP